jgi:hypothetical protein
MGLVQVLDRHWAELADVATRMRQCRDREKTAVALPPTADVLVVRPASDPLSRRPPSRLDRNPQSESRAQSASCRKGPSNSSQRGYFREHDWPRPWLGERGSSLAGLAEIACDPGSGAGAGQFVGGRHPHLCEKLACTITRGELAVRVVVIRDNVEAHHNRC